MSESRAQRILNALVDGRVLTPAGLAWLTLAVDPWHDNAVTGLEGLPDQSVGKSVSFQVVQEISISKNTSPTVLPAGNWSCRIGNLPIMTTEYVNPSPIKQGTVLLQDNASASTVAMQPIQVNYAADGVPFSAVVAAAPIVSGSNPQGIALPIEYLQGNVKVLGVGIEVINTTSPLHRQGLMSCCRMTQPDAETTTAYVALTTPPNAWAQMAFNTKRSLPNSLKEMALYPGFAQMEAKEGYYAPVLLKFGRDRHFPTFTQTLLVDEDLTFGPQDGKPDIPAWSSTLTSRAISGNTTPFYSPRNFPMHYDCDSNCIIFSGLSDETTLTLRVRFILERFPSDSEGQLLVIATPTATYDPVALELYSRAVQRLPAGVPFSENPAGEWWMKMVEEVANAAAPFLGAIHPGLGIAAKGLGTVLGAAAGRSKESRKKKERKAKSNPPPVVKPLIPQGVRQIAASPQARPSATLGKKPLPKPPQRK